MKLPIVLVFLTLSFIAAINVSAAEHRLGIGANYWSSLDDIKADDGDIDDDGFSIIGMYQYWPSLLGFGLEAEFLPDRFGETAVAPAAYVFIGKAIYGGAGIGITYSDGDFADQPFFALRAGLDLEIVPAIHLNIYGNYRFNDKAEFKDDDTDIDTDTIFLGGALLFGF